MCTNYTYVVFGPVQAKDTEINRKIDFSFDSAHCASFMKVGSKLIGGGGGRLHILSWDRAQVFYAGVEYRLNFFSKSHAP